METKPEQKEIKYINLSKEIYEMDKTKLLTIDEIDMLSWMNQELNDYEKEILIGLLTKFYNFK
jgi:hypothetical protein